jgi:hypothetical protein
MAGATAATGVDAIGSQVGAVTSTALKDHTPPSHVQQYGDGAVRLVLTSAFEGGSAASTKSTGRKAVVEAAARIEGTASSRIEGTVAVSCELT